MAKSKVKKTGQGFIIEGVMNYDDETLEVEELGEYPFDKIFKQFDGKLVKITVKEPDEDVVAIPEEA